MIQLVIPTYKRLDNQITLNSIPKKFRKHITLVVQPQEEERALEIHPQIFVLSGNDIGIAQTRKEIAKEWGCNRKVRHWILDDDLKILKHTEVMGGRLEKSPINGRTFLECIDEIEAAMDEGFSHGGIGTTWINPIGKYPYNDNFRIVTNVFYDGLVLCDIFKEIDWLLDGAEDFYVNLQLLTKGMKNRVIYKFTTDPGHSNATGGCSTYRDIEFHNKACRKLVEKFPDYVTLRMKVLKSGPWKGIEKAAVVCRWKDAYNSFGKPTIEKFYQ
jgi:hypothetical protein